jgi:hypothetical protein
MAPKKWTMCSIDRLIRHVEIYEHVRIAVEAAVVEIGDRGET